MTVRITVSLPDHLVAAARDAVSAGRAASVSAYVAGALAAVSGQDSLAQILADLDAELGSVSDHTTAWVDAELARVDAELARGRPRA